MVLAERNSELVRNGRRSRGPSPNGHGGSVTGSTIIGGNSNIGCGGGAGTPETSSDDDNSIKRNGKSKTKQSEYEEKIRVGRDYQAVCPPLIPETERKPEGLNDRALLVWSPTREIPDAKLEEYISVAKEKYGYNGEQALGMLFWHKHDLERAVLDLANFTPFPDEWTVEDKVLFEQAFQFHGKSFHRIRQMLPDKSIASLVKYYYSWKKTRHRQSVMDRQEKAKASKEGSDNGSENGSNEESDTDDKDQTLASTSGLQDQTKIGGVGPSADLPNKSVKSNDIGGVGGAAGSSSGCGGSAEVDSENIAAPASLNANATGRDSGLIANVVGTKHLRQQTPPNTANTDSSCSNVDSTGLSGCCTNCGVPCSILNASPHGKLCSSCHHHWRRTGNKRPTSGPYFGKRSRDRNAERHKRKPPRGMYINHDDIVALARSNDNQDELLANTDREIVSLLSQVQLNKQNISALKRTNSEGLEDIRPAENANRINSRWSNDEALLVVQGVRKYGKDFQTIAETIGTKTETHVRTFFVSNRRRYNLDQELKKYEAEKEEALATTATAATASAATVDTSNVSTKNEDVKKRDISGATGTTGEAGGASSGIADESDNTTSSETTVSKSTNDESKFNSSNNSSQKDNVIMEIDLDTDQTVLPPPSKKFALGVGGQEFPKASTT
ncbi:REST corepressor isoform X1 [Eurosta solidaginis]|uniref:REST corepressor isoform X1 n=1 Tax=Eurosta solidaginis TaxID=178769 RepID=UPI0035313E3A